MPYHLDQHDKTEKGHGLLMWLLRRWQYSRFQGQSFEGEQRGTKGRRNLPGKWPEASTVFWLQAADTQSRDTGEHD